jgi:hypothetical protein
MPLRQCLTSRCCAPGAKASAHSASRRKPTAFKTPDVEFTNHGSIVWIRPLTDLHPHLHGYDRGRGRCRDGTLSRCDRCALRHHLRRRCRLFRHCVQPDAAGQGPNQMDLRLAPQFRRRGDGPVSRHATDDGCPREFVWCDLLWRRCHLRLRPGARTLARYQGLAGDVLHKFVGGPGDGSESPMGLVFDKNGNLFGAIPNGGANGNGTIFEIPKSGCGFGPEVLIASFTYATTGYEPSGDRLAIAVSRSVAQQSETGKLSSASRRCGTTAVGGGLVRGRAGAGRKRRRAEEQSRLGDES